MVVWLPTLLFVCFLTYSCYDGFIHPNIPVFKIMMKLKQELPNLFYYKTRPRGYKTFFVLNSVEHEILNAYKYKNIKKLGLFKVQITLECYFPAHKC